MGLALCYVIGIVDQVPIRGAETAEQYLLEGRETRRVASHSQTLPCFATCRALPESRAGWADGYMCRPKAEQTATGVYTFLHLHQWEHAVTYSDPIGDGNLYAFCLEVQVVLEGVSRDGMRNSLGGIFYQEAVQIVAVLVESETLGMMTGGQDNLSKGTDVKIFRQGGGKSLRVERGEIGPAQG
jgi:hypothetical protein